MSKKYIKQKTKFECGPICMLNAFVWADKKVSYSSTIHYFKNALNYVDRFGTEVQDFTKALKKQKKPFKILKIKKNPTIKFFKQFIDDNTTIILGFNRGYSSHVTLAISKSDKYIKFVNWGGKRVITDVPIKQLKKWIKLWSIAYVIRKIA